MRPPPFAIMCFAAQKLRFAGTYQVGCQDALPGRLPLGIVHLLDHVVLADTSIVHHHVQPAHARS